MTIENIYGNILSNIIEIMIFHDQVNQIFNFIGFYETANYHRQIYIKQLKIYNEICDYYINNYNRIPKLKRINDSNPILNSLYGKKREDITPNIQMDIIDEWLRRKRKLKKTYESMYGELVLLGEITSANELSVYITDSNNMIKEIENHKLYVK